MIVSDLPRFRKGNHGRHEIAQKIKELCQWFHQPRKCLEQCPQTIGFSCLFVPFVIRHSSFVILPPRQTMSGLQGSNADFTCPHQNVSGGALPPAFAVALWLEHARNAAGC